MSVGEQLGLDDPNDGLRVQARARWDLWADRYPQLGAFAGPESLREWLRAADPDARDEALSALGALGSRDGADDCAAAGALLWVLLPGASLLARRLRGFSPIIDELVAAQLWLEARTLPATTTQRVAAIILRNTLREVLRRAGADPCPGQDCGRGASCSNRFPRSCWRPRRPATTPAQRPSSSCCCTARAASRSSARASGTSC